MATTSKVILVEPEPRPAAAVALGLARLGHGVEHRADAAGADEVTRAAGLVIVGAGADAPALIRRWRADGVGAAFLALVAADDGDHASARAAALEAGADEVIAGPSWLRDIGLVSSLLLARSADKPGGFAGALGALSSMFALLRAVAAIGRSGVLTLGRGFRRGEVRYCDGEITSVQAGGHHGQAALHQLLLWSEARFDFRREDVVRRRQIPLSPEELFADAERFLVGVREAAGGMSPVEVYELDAQLAEANVGRIPSEVGGVLRLFDGQRTIGDLLEDSPYRVFETLRVILRARELGLLRPAATARRAPTWTPQLDLERWLVGAADAPPPAKRPAGGRGKKARRRTPVPGRASTEVPVVDWGTLAPRMVGVELGGLAGVVPAARMAGELHVAATPVAAPAPATTSRGEVREGLESLTSAEARDRAFAVEPSRTLTPVSSQPPEVASGEIGPRTRTPSAGVGPRPSSEAPITQSGEIAPRNRTTSAPPVEPAQGVLVADLAMAHSQALAAPLPAAATVQAPPPAAAPFDAKVEAARVGATSAAGAFSDDEEAFFRAGTAPAPTPAPKVEVFEDLDRGYEPLGFWQRLRGKTRPPSSD
ncbi:MAG: DUF4388 domain-containing protein [Kofleriaceae bacterium]